MAKISSKKGKDTGQFFLRDYAHAAKTFLAEPGYVMSPKLGWLFHVRIEFNPNAPGAAQQGGDNSKTISVLAKRADLPKFNIETDTLNRYNRKELVHKKITYEPVTIVFHDDVKNTIRNMWLAYQSYYNADPGTSPESWSRYTYANDQGNNRYGLDNNRPDQRFIKSVDIYAMGNHTYTKYSLVNPLISSFDFDTYDYSEGTKTMEAQIKFDYENVFYFQGSTENIPGFGKDSPYYDNQYSTLSTSLANPSGLIIDQIEKFISKTEPPKIEKTYADQIRTLPVRISPEQVNTIRAVAVNSLQSNQRFSFPSAGEIRNVSSLVDITGRRRATEQGRINTAGFVVSNGVKINTGAPSSQGQRTTVAADISGLVVSPKVPSNLTSTERQAFLNAYPPLPSTDARTRLPPYV